MMASTNCQMQRSEAEVGVLITIGDGGDAPRTCLGIMGAIVN